MEHLLKLANQAESAALALSLIFNAVMGTAVIALATAIVMMWRHANGERKRRDAEREADLERHRADYAEREQRQDRVRDGLAALVEQNTEANINTRHIVDGINRLLERGRS